MTIQGKLKTFAELEDFLLQFKSNGHRDETCAFVRDMYGRELGSEHFVTLYQQALGYLPHTPPSRARGLYEYLAKCGIIRTDER